MSKSGMMFDFHDGCTLKSKDGKIHRMELAPEKVFIEIVDGYAELHLVFKSEQKVEKECPF